MKNRNIGLEILEGLKQIKAYKKEQMSLKITEMSKPLKPKVSSEEIGK